MLIMLINVFDSCCSEKKDLVGRLVSIWLHFVALPRVKPLWSKKTAAHSCIKHHAAFPHSL